MPAPTPAITHALITGAIAFVATNLDDLLVLMVLLARPPYPGRDRQILLGQYLGLGALVLVSLLGFGVGLWLPPWVIGLLGIGPIAIGLCQLRDRDCSPDRLATRPPDLPAIAPGTTTRKPTTRGDRNRLGWLPWQQCCAPQTLQVATITIACGADNLGVYIPLFAACHWLELATVLGTFALGVALLFWVARRFSQQPIVLQWINRFGHQTAPWVLMAIGFWIIWDNLLTHAAPPTGS